MTSTSSILRNLLASIALAACLVLPGCALLPDVHDLEEVLPPPEAYETGIVVPEFAQ